MWEDKDSIDAWGSIEEAFKIIDIQIEYSNKEEYIICGIKIEEWEIGFRDEISSYSGVIENR